MDRHWAGPVRDDDQTLRQLGEDRALPSRAAALGVLRAALQAQAGLILVTGAAGVGKTWLCRRLQAEWPSPWSWVAVDLTPATDTAGLYRLIGHGLGLAESGAAGASRLILTDFLQQGAADGERWVLVVDEAQNASEVLWEEIRILGNRLGRPDGFAGLILVGQTPLALRIATRPLTAVEARLSARVHLRPFDCEEARAFLRGQTPGLAHEDEALEKFHRDTGGNPRRLLQLASLLVPNSDHTPRNGTTRPAVSPVTAVSPAPAAAPVPFAAPTPAPTPSTSPARTDRAPAWEAPAVGTSRTLREVEEGVVEVGWEPTAEADLSADPVTETAQAPASGPVEAPATTAETEETINDHYAALQAWTEWAKNQGQNPVAELDASEATASLPYQAGNPGEERDRTREVPGHSVVWAEGQQGFAPYSQLFSRLKQAKEPL